jgi:hypothetical protein
VTVTTNPGSAPPTDRLGTPLTPAEAELLRLYEDLKRYVARTDLPPCAARNARKALAALHVAANDLDLVYEHLYDLGV